MLDRESRYPNRIKLNPVSGQSNVFDVERADEPIVEGTRLDKALLDHAVAANGVTSGTDTAFILDDESFSLDDGAKINFKLHVDSGATPTINVNNTGDKALMASRYKPMPKVFAGIWLTAVYCADLDFFVLQGSGGGSASRFGNELNQISEIEMMNRVNKNIHLSKY